MAAAQGTCLNPMAAIAAAQMQQMAAFNVSGLVAAPLTPSSGTIPPSFTPHLACCPGGGGLPVLTPPSCRYKHPPWHQHGARAQHRHADRGERLQPAATADQRAARLRDHLHQRHPPLPR